MRTKVSLVGCKNYDYKDVKQALKNSFINLGGIQKYINKNDKVLLKINLLMNKKPEEAVTTHPVFVKALAELLVEYGAKVVIGDSPGGLFNKKMLERIYKGTGIIEIEKEPDIKLNYNTNALEVKNEKGKYLKKLTVTEMLKDVDKVISVSKLKTHSMMTFTGAVKNLFGTIPGTLKAEYHFRMPDVNDFANALIDICLSANPVLSFMDGIIGMEGDGPSAGKPRKIGVVLASPSPVHLDVTAVNLIGLKPEDVPIIKQSIKRKLCLGTLEDIEIIGEDIQKYSINDFMLSKNMSITFIDDKMPKFIKNIVYGATKPKPVFDYKKCIGCRECEKNCPAKVITIVNNKPKVDLSGCIRCFCCQELCPQKAVEVKQTLLMKIISKM